MSAWSEIWLRVFRYNTKSLLYEKNGNKLGIINVRDY